LVAAVIAGGIYLKKNKTEGTTGQAIQSVAVLPFKNESGNAEVEYLSDGMTETLINSLSRLPNIAVKSKVAVARYKGKDIDPQQVASQLSVQAILLGRLVQRVDNLTLYLSLVDARNGNQLWGEHYDRSMKDLAVLQTDIARDVSQKLRPLTTSEKQALTKGNTTNSEAYRAYLRGMYYWSKCPAPGCEKSREYFQQAIDLDPVYALGYVGLAHYYGFTAAVGALPPNENWLRSEAAVNKAIELDDSLAETYNVRAGPQLYFHRDWVAAEQSFRRGLELNPNSVEVHNHYGRCLILFGRNEEAIAEGRRTVDLEPLSLRYNLNLATLFFFTRQWDRAIDQLHKTLELEPNYGPAHEWLGYSYEQKGMQKEAVAEWVTALKLRRQDDYAGKVDRAYAASGFAAAARAMAQRDLDDSEERSKRGEYVAAAEFAYAYTRLGDKDKALAWIDKAVDERTRYPLELRVNPLYDWLRDDPRFQASLKRVVVAQ
jgi:TolB-like protein/Tfp pilus assembly protein PilF